jgi:hypothetical protein
MAFFRSGSGSKLRGERAGLVSSATFLIGDAAQTQEGPYLSFFLCKKARLFAGAIQISGMRQTSSASQRTPSWLRTFTRGC